MKTKKFNGYKITLMSATRGIHYTYLDCETREQADEWAEKERIAMASDYSAVWGPLDVRPVDSALRLDESFVEHIV